jgi:hypothetical protein
MTVIRHCPCGNVGTPDVSCAGFPGVWNEERGDFERGACLGEDVEYVPAEQLRGAVEAARAVLESAAPCAVGNHHVLTANLDALARACGLPTTSGGQ